jgi:glycosyltransferase involved in cell wall biosynthesis
MQEGKVSVIIPNYNYERFLGKAVDSALGQTYHDIEVIVVDDGSKDGSREIIDGYAGRIEAIFQKNQGVAAARNNGVAAAGGEYIAFLDADDVWLPAKLELQVGMFADDPELGMVHVGIVEIDDAGNCLDEHLDGQQGWVADELLRFERGVILGGGSGILVRRDVFDEIGGFDARMSTSADWDLFYRIASRHPVGFIPRVLLKYRIHASNMHSNIKAMEHDMMLGYQKAFANGITVDRRICYGNLHKTLAGSYFHAGQYRSFVRQAIRSLINRPANLGYFLKFPLRRMGAK